MILPSTVVKLQLDRVVMKTNRMQSGMKAWRSTSHRDRLGIPISVQLADLRGKSQSNVAVSRAESQSVGSRPWLVIGIKPGKICLSPAQCLASLEWQSRYAPYISAQKDIVKRLFEASSRELSTTGWSICGRALGSNRTIASLRLLSGLRVTMMDKLFRHHLTRTSDHGRPQDFF